MRKFKSEGIDFEQYRYGYDKRPMTYFYKDSGTHIFIKLNNNTEGMDKWDMEKSNRKYFLAALRVAKKLGYEEYIDEDFERQFKSLMKTHKFASNGKVNFTTHYYVTGLDFEFWATGKRYCLTNRHEGLRELSYIEKKRIQLLCRKIAEKWESMGVERREVSYPEFKYAYDKVAHHKFSCWHWKKEHDMLDIFSQQYTSGNEPSKYNSKDKDKKQLRNGQEKYFYNYDGKLCRGIITHNINNMWWVLVNDYECRNVAAFDLFDFVSFKETPLKKVEPYKIKRHLEKALKEEDFLKAHLIKQERDKVA